MFKQVTLLALYRQKQMITKGDFFMESLIATATSILTWLQMPAIIGAAIAFCIGGYYLMFGGDQGRQTAIKWFIGGAVGLVIILGAKSLADSVSTNITF